jgi:outer membrane protein TolC
MTASRNAYRWPTLLALTALVGCSGLRGSSSEITPPADVATARPRDAVITQATEPPSAPPAAEAVESIALVSAQEDPPPVVPQDRAEPVESGVEVHPLVEQPAQAAADPLELVEVLQSVRSLYPEVQIARQLRITAGGEQLESLGEFDLKFQGEAIAQPEANYENFRYNFGLKQWTPTGVELFAGYRLGRGQFEPWYLERETEKGGEFKVGAALPLGQGLATDERRTAIARASWELRMVEPRIQLELIESVREGSEAYWLWVAAGQRVRIGQQLLDIALDRNRGLQAQVDLGNNDPIVLVDNRQLIVNRQAKLVGLQQKLLETALKLSLYWRAPDGSPVAPDLSALPKSFPEPLDPSGLDSVATVDQALMTRPELLQLAQERQQILVDRKLAENQMLPDFDAVTMASQDFGGAGSKSNDKGQLQLEAGFVMEVPLQRRKARGKLQSADGKLAQNTAKQQLTRDKIVTEVVAAETALQAAYRQYLQATELVELNVRLEQAEGDRFQLGDSDLLMLNLREQNTANAREALVDALLNYYLAEVALRAALADEVLTAK